MFYGFPRKSKTLEKSLRQKYTPWNGGSFGGNLTFAYQGQYYRIERTFGANPKGDTFAVIDLDTGRKTNRFPEEIGQELFGLDADAFELFLEKGVFDKETAGAFKKLVEMGGSKDPMREYRNFRGADPAPEALLRARGLI